MQAIFWSWFLPALSPISETELQIYASILPPPQSRQIANSCKDSARILFLVATLFIFLLILAGCTGSIVPPPKAEELPPSSQLAQTESQVTTSDSPDIELAAVLTAEATALFKQTLLLKAEEEFLNALEAGPNHIPVVT